MKAVKSKHTQFENKVTKILWNHGFRFRKNTNMLGKPDISIKKYKIVIFLDSCFWHGCKLHCRLPEANKDYWSTKIAKNKKRDREVTNFYETKGWHILRIWEHQIKEDFNGAILDIEKFFIASKNHKNIDCR